LSKQSNQRYRKEKDKELFKKDGSVSNSVEAGGNSQNSDKINREFKTSSGGTDKKLN
jgi:hypothetical protein